MEISYLGHTSFKIRAKSGTVVMDPYGKSVGFSMPSVSADIVTVSHRGVGDYIDIGAVSATSRRKAPFVIEAPGEYEVEGISIFGYGTFHDDKKGEERGSNNIYIVQVEDTRILHLGSLGHMLSDKMIDTLDGIDVLMIPVGGVYTIDAKVAAELVSKIEPSYVLPMHYLTDEHDKAIFGEMVGVEKFLEQVGMTSKTVKSLSINKATMLGETSEIVLFDK